MANEMRQEYPIGAGRYANSRLNLQHYQIMHELDNALLDSHIPTNTSNQRIADVCCGTGLWLLQVARQYPLVELHAFDINLNNLPPPGLTPQIQRQKYNLFEIPPIELQGTFDVVNVQLTHTFVSDTRIDSVLENILLLLKPGGWLQWTEFSTVTSVHSPTHVSSSDLSCLSRVFADSYALLGVQIPTWPDRLDSILTQHNLQNIHATRPGVDLSLLRGCTERHFVSFQETVESFLKLRGNTPENKVAVAKYQQTVEGAYVEFLETGAGLWFPIVRAVGRKA